MGGHVDGEQAAPPNEWKRKYWQLFVVLMSFVTCPVVVKHLLPNDDCMGFSIWIKKNKMGQIKKTKALGSYLPTFRLNIRLDLISADTQY